jgi:peptidyl-tRNA hydrolase
VGRLETEFAQAKLRADHAHAEADARVEGGKIEADDRVARAMAQSDQRFDQLRADIAVQVRRLEQELEQAHLRADRAEQWLVRIRHEIEGELMPSFREMHNRLRPPEAH